MVLHAIPDKNGFKVLVPAHLAYVYYALDWNHFWLKQTKEASINIRIVLPSFVKI